MTGAYGWRACGPAGSSKPSQRRPHQRHTLASHPCRVVTVAPREAAMLAICCLPAMAL